MEDKFLHANDVASKIVRRGNVARGRIRPVNVSVFNFTRVDVLDFEDLDGAVRSINFIVPIVRLVRFPVRAAVKDAVRTNGIRVAFVARFFVGSRLILEVRRIGIAMEQLRPRDGLAHMARPAYAHLALLDDGGGRAQRYAHSMGEDYQAIFRCLGALGIVYVRPHGDQAGRDGHVSQEWLVNASFCSVIRGGTVCCPR